jgi:hypothetical protein
MEGLSCLGNSSSDTKAFYLIRGEIRQSASNAIANLSLGFGCKSQIRRGLGIMQRFAREEDSYVKDAAKTRHEAQNPRDVPLQMNEPMRSACKSMKIIEISAH